MRKKFPIDPLRKSNRELGRDNFDISVCTYRKKLRNNSLFSELIPSQSLPLATLKHNRTYEFPRQFRSHSVLARVPSSLLSLWLISFLIADCSGVISFMSRINRERMSPIPGPPMTLLISEVEPPLSLLSELSFKCKDSPVAAAASTTWRPSETALSPSTSASSSLASISSGNSTPAPPGRRRRTPPGSTWRSSRRARPARCRGGRSAGRRGAARPRAPERLASLARAPRDRCGTRTRPAPCRPGDEDVALALVDVLAARHRGSRCPEPVHVRGGLGSPLGVAEAGAEHRPSITVAPLAANTMSGSPGTGSMISTE